MCTHMQNNLSFENSSVKCKLHKLRFWVWFPNTTIKQATSLSRPNHCYHLLSKKSFLRCLLMRTLQLGFTSSHVSVFFPVRSQLLHLRSPLLISIDRSLLGVFVQSVMLYEVFSVFFPLHDVFKIHPCSMCGIFLNNILLYGQPTTFTHWWMFEALFIWGYYEWWCYKYWQACLCVNMCFHC